MQTALIPFGIPWFFWFVSCKMNRDNDNIIQKIARMFGGLATPPGTFHDVRFLRMRRVTGTTYITDFTSNKETIPLHLLTIFSQLF